MTAIEVVVTWTSNFTETQISSRTGSTKTRTKVDIACGIRTATNALRKKAGKHRLENNTWNCFPFKIIKKYIHHRMNVVDTSIRDNLRSNIYEILQNREKYAVWLK
jgi:hypothetical protein